MSTKQLPRGKLDSQAHAFWLAGQKQEAINALLAVINREGMGKDPDTALQLGHYLFFSGDPASAAQVLELTRQQHPRNAQVLLNLGICLSRARQFLAAMERINEYVALVPNDPLAFDALCSAAYQSGRFLEAAAAGERALQFKDAAHCLPLNPSNLPAAPVTDSQLEKQNVIAFSLWGNNPRYLRGAIDNALAADSIYPGWRLRFYVDKTVPEQLLAKLAGLGCELAFEPIGQSQRMRLGWRFKVANDSTVGRFLVRDVDSLINLREKRAVDEWIASNKLFHVMRDWWSHTDLILAGMWGGVAGNLPDLTKLLKQYRPQAMETPNVDQWFLRDCIWALIRENCLIHDRCFRSRGSSPWPGPAPIGSDHVGQDVFSAAREAQAERLRDYLRQLPCLGLPSHQKETGCLG